ncbi:Uncharacterized protein APZ42_017513 [Daphnia magna]|uniref:Uncharacterized protein n=1 Tax=Daphnia magna TaxID=35525 RepID=A0A164ZWU8_9CRUS|nr:Uncharacterized protein APZ42_017513 [Daphnia magna]
MTQNTTYLSSFFLLAFGAALYTNGYKEQRAGESAGRADAVWKL